MPVDYQIATRVTTNNGSVTIPSIKVSGDAELVYDDLIPAATVNKQIVMALDVSELKAIVIAVTSLGSGKTVTIKTNSSGTPVDTITLTSTVPGVAWYTGAPGDSPLSADVTSFYVSNDDTAARRLQIYACADVTPA